MMPTYWGRMDFLNISNIDIHIYYIICSLITETNPAYTLVLH